jgi:hypothetical protein
MEWVALIKGYLSDSITWGMSILPFYRSESSGSSKIINRLSLPNIF